MHTLRIAQARATDSKPTLYMDMESTTMLNYAVKFYQTGRRAYTTYAAVPETVRTDRREIVAVRMAAHGVWLNASVVELDNGSYSVNGGTATATVTPN